MLLTWCYGLLTLFGLFVSSGGAKTNLDLPPFTWGCGEFQKASSTNTGIRFIVIFPGFPLKAGAQPKVYLLVSAFDPVGTKVKYDDGRKTTEKCVRLGFPKMFSYTIKTPEEQKIYLVKSITNIQVHVTVEYQAPDDKVHSYSYWAVPRMTYDKFYYAISNNPRNPSVSFIAIVASEYKETTVTVQVPGGKKESFNLKRWEFRKLEESINDVSGVRISADREVAVFSGNGPTQNQDVNDVMMEQIIPPTAYGQTYLTLVPPNLPEEYQYKLKFLASQETTRVTVFQQPFPISQAGESQDVVWRIQGDFIRGQAIPIQINKPTLVVLYMLKVLPSGEISNGTNSDQAMIMLPPKERWDVKFILYTPSGYNSVAVLTIETAKKEKLFYNDDQRPFTWTEDKQTGLSIASMTLGEGVHKFRTRPKEDKVKFGGWVYGRSADSTRSFGQTMGMMLPQRRCVPCRGFQCDAMDNDCDGKINEEICNGKDDDGDSWVDEDCCGYEPPGAKLTAGEIALAIFGSLAGAGLLVMIIVLIVILTT